MSTLKKFVCAIALMATATSFASVQQIDTEEFVTALPARTPSPVLEEVTMLDDGTKLSKVRTRGLTVFIQQDLRGRIIRSQLEGAAEIQNLHYDDSSAHGLPVPRSTTNITTGAVSYRVLRGVSGDERKSFSLEIQDPENFDFNSLSLIIEDPFGSGWEMLGMNPQPPRCTKDRCKDLCAGGAGSGSLGCATMGLVNPVGAVVCEAVILGAWAWCVDKCERSCQ